MFGTDFCRAARAAGHQTVPASRGSDPNDTYIDITNVNQVRELVLMIKPDCIVHGAALTDVDYCELHPETALLINAVGAKNVAQAAQQVGAYMVCISTDFVFSGHSARPYRESDTPAPINSYGQSKRVGELNVLSSAENSCVVRTSWLYGPYGQSFASAVIARAREAGEIALVNDQWGSPTSTRDLSAAVLQILSTRFSGVVHAANDGVVCRSELGKTILSRADIQCKIEEMSALEYVQKTRPAAPRPTYSALDSALLGKTTGHKMRPWELALNEFIDELNNKAA